MKVILFTTGDSLGLMVYVTLQHKQQNINLPSSGGNVH